MRLWSLHPRYLDPRGLVALWREALLAKAVLAGKTRGYTRHPQLERFRAQPRPRAALNAYLAGIHAEATARGYHFAAAKIGPRRAVAPIVVTAGQLEFEWQHLQRKLAQRDPDLLARPGADEIPGCHPLFQIRPGPVAAWERGHVRAPGSR